MLTGNCHLPGFLHLCTFSKNGQITTDEVTSEKAIKKKKSPLVLYIYNYKKKKARQLTNNCNNVDDLRAQCQCLLQLSRLTKFMEENVKVSLTDHLSNLSTSQPSLSVYTVHCWNPVKKLGQNRL